MSAASKLDAADGVDVTARIGIGPTPEEAHYYALLKGHFARAKAEPSIETFRLCVEAYDNLLAEIRKR